MKLKFLRRLFARKPVIHIDSDDTLTDDMPQPRRSISGRSISGNCRVSLVGVLWFHSQGESRKRKEIEIHRDDYAVASEDKEFVFDTDQLPIWSFSGSSCGVEYYVAAGSHKTPVDIPLSFLTNKLSRPVRKIVMFTGNKDHFGYEFQIPSSISIASSPAGIIVAKIWRRDDVLQEDFDTDPRDQDTRISFKIVEIRHIGDNRIIETMSKSTHVLSNDFHVTTIKIPSSCAPTVSIPEHGVRISHVLGCHIGDEVFKFDLIIDP